MQMRTLIVCCTLLMALVACNNDGLKPLDDQQLELPLPSFDYSIPDVPIEVAHMTEQVTINNAAAALGRVLFYDKNLSLNNTVSCASCHLQENAFADPKPASVGFEGKLTPRNSMAISNPLLIGNLFWDSRSPHLMDLALKPVENHIEMGIENYSALEAKLRNLDYYQPLFAAAYPGAPINKQGIAAALTEFMTSMITFDSKFDRGLNNDFADFTPLEKIGKDLFFSERLNCTACHAAPTFTQANNVSHNPYTHTKGTANIGLEKHYADPGFRDGMFKIPTLRNVGVTAPYMHDGRFASLEEVIHHYSAGIEPHPNLDDNLKITDGTPRLLHLNNAEQKALVAFLHTLTDESFLTDAKYSNPFR